MSALAAPRRQASLLAVAAVAAAAAAGVAAAATTNPLLVVAALFGLGYVAYTVHELVGGIAIFIVVSFVEQMPGAGSGVTMAKGAGAVLVAAWAVGAARRRWTFRDTLARRLGFTLAAAALFLWALGSAAWAADSHTAISSALRLGQGMLVALVVVAVVVDEHALRILVAAFVVGGAASGVLGLAGVAGVGGTSSSATSDVTRIGGGLGDPNYLAAVLVPALFLTLALHATAVRRAARLLLLGTGIVLVVALFRTESRGGMVALAAATVAVLVVGGPLRRRAIGAILATGAAGAAYFVLFASPAAATRLVTLDSGGSGRTELWSVAFDAFRAHPLGGVGLGNWSIVEPLYAAHTNTNLTKPYLEFDLGEVVHNTYLHLLAELGVVGFVLFGLLLLVALRSSLRACTAVAEAGDRRLELLLRGLLVGAIGMLVAFAFLTAQYEKQLWIVLALLLAASEVARRRVAEPRLEPGG